MCAKTNLYKKKFYILLSGLCVAYSDMNFKTTYTFYL